MVCSKGGNGCHVTIEAADELPDREFAAMDGRFGGGGGGAWSGTMRDNDYSWTTTGANTVYLGKGGCGGDGLVRICVFEQEEEIIYDN